MNSTHMQTGMSAKQLLRAAEKSKREYLQYEAKAKSAIRAGNLPLARTHGESAMRCKSQAVTYLRLEAQVQGAQAKLSSAQAQQAAAGSLGEVAGLLEGAQPALADAAAALERYGAAAEGVDVQTQYMDGAFEETTASAAPAQEVDNLLHAIAAENALDTAGLLPAAPQHAAGAYAQRAPQQNQPQRQGAGAQPLPK